MKLTSIQQLRAVAMTAVVVQHFLEDELLYEHLGPWLSMSHVGVYLFFAISGFVMTKVIFENFDLDNGRFRPLREHRSDLKVYFARRFWRIAPVAGVLFVLLAIIAAGGRLPWGNLAVVAALFSTATTDFFMAINLILNYPIGTFGLWTIAGEEKLYFVLPLLVIVAASRPRAVKACLGMVALSVLFLVGLGVLGAIYNKHVDLIAYYSIPNFCRDFFVGALVYLLARRSPSLPKPALGPLAVVVFIGAAHGLFPTVMANLVVSAGSALLLLWAAQGHALVRPGRVQRLLDYLGDRSYSLYLLHLPIFILVRWLGQVHSLPLRAAVQGVVLLALVEVVYRAVERPGMAYGRRRHVYRARKAENVAPLPAAQTGVAAHPELDLVPGAVR